MSVIHISREEAVSNFESIIAKVCAGDEIRIDDESATIAVVSAPLQMKQPRMLSEIIAALDKDVRVDQGFANDVEGGIHSQEQERLIDPWESF